MEVRLINPVGSLAMAAHGTGAAGVARIDRDHHHSGQCGFVCQQAPKLTKGPRMARTALRPSNRPPLADPGQILDGECLTGRACLRNQLFADAVVDIPLKARLTAGLLPEPPASAAGVHDL
ncbi:MAG TPA: hypothetical protein PKA05_22645, partial [Roseiflexaceae bacterium]|nr:hypothetical protein [Roseiflexaceae bacterium]